MRFSALGFLCVLLLIVHSVSALSRYCGSQPPELPPFIPPLPSNATLVQVQVLIRHGDRTTASAAPCWPGDDQVWLCELTSLEVPNNSQTGSSISSPGRLFRKTFMMGRNYFRGNCNTGQLTTLGLNQQYNNGEIHRKAYVESGFLSQNFNRSEIYVRSDNVYRTQQSAESFITGMFPVSQAGESAEVVELHTMDTTYDDITPNPNLCPKYEVNVQNFWKSALWLEHYEKFTAPLLDRISKALGSNISLDQLSHFHDCLETHACHSFPIPVSQKLFVAIEVEMNWQYSAAYHYPNRTAQAQVGIGFLIEDMYNHIKSAMQSLNNPSTHSFRKFILFSGHDTSLMPFLAAFDVWDNLWVPYASTSQLELLQLSNGQFAVRLIFNGKVMLIPGCSSEICDWNSFEQVVKQLIPNNPSVSCYN